MGKKSMFNWSHLWLLLGCTAVLFTGGKWNIPFFTWIGPVFLLRFFRTCTHWRQTLVAVPALLAASFLFMVGLMPFPPEISVLAWIIATIVVTIFTILPYFVDRALARRLTGLPSALVFPAAISIIHFLYSFSPTGTGGAWGYSLWEMKSLIQVVSLTGFWGLSFLIAFFASTVNAWWEQGFELRRTKNTVLVFTVLFSLVLAYGGLRRTFFLPAAETVKVGSVVVEWPEDNLFWRYILMEEATEEKAPEYRRHSLRMQDELFALSAQLIPAGIKFLTWPTGNAVVFAEDEPAYIERVRVFAREHGIYFFPSILLIRPGAVYTENKVLAVTPDGEVAFVYHKTEASFDEPLEETSGELMFLDTPYGRISTAVCFDMDFPGLIRQAGRNKVDIMLVAADSPTVPVSRYHTKMAMFRGIENGFSTVRTVLEGLTMSTDYHGRVLSRMDFYTTRERILITHVPVKGVNTLYSAWGDWLVWLSALFLLIASARAITGRALSAGRQKTQNK